MLLLVLGYNLSTLKHIYVDNLYSDKYCVYFDSTAIGYLQENDSLVIHIKNDSLLINYIIK